MVAPQPAPTPLDPASCSIIGAVEAIGEGVRKVIFADGRVDDPISKALAGAGTHIA